MFSFFSTRKKLIGTGIFAGATDWHSHILPGVDDGIRKMEDSLAVLAYYEKIGIKEVWLTPHIMEDMPNTPEGLQARFQELQEAYQGPVKLNLAAENMLDNLFNERLAANQLMPIGPKGDHLLVETSYFQPPIDLYGTLKRIQEIGYTPILAHPERYIYMEESNYEYLVSMKVKLQLNIVSLAGADGQPAQDKAQMLLSKGNYSFFGSDLHNLGNFMASVNTKGVRKEMVPLLPGIQNNIL
jgi:tyrosine-protein phosphatase YwqE